MSDLKLEAHVTCPRCGTDFDHVFKPPPKGVPTTGFDPFDPPAVETMEELLALLAEQEANGISETVTCPGCKEPFIAVWTPP